MASYRPKKVLVTAGSMHDGAITLATLGTLLSWYRSLFKGFVKNSAGVALVSAAVEVIKIATGGASSSLGLTFTDASGEYGVSLPTLLGTAKYRFDYYDTPN
ncbi:hypothetical protein [Clostridium uliginosum]|uniref:Uncharacterized protein n=1 Tax=Clostridium uliginosum TaxID=119641 RepID=A0A1I1HNY3_9CLOT|nr:hypothetical protein [Clostridium uliginosum]SFC22730.1 hypothetical protein SAMN05421842_101292 [Clostridium uliginosum]